MKCKECGQENIEDAKFCRSCGAILSAEPSKEITLVSDQLNLAERLIKNRFKVIKKLGKGGMGEVLLAEDLKLKRKIAIKSILTNTITDTSSKARFLREAQTASRLDHPNICTIYEVYEENYHDYIVMQYVDGVTIDQIIKLKPLSVNKTMDIALQVCRGMVEAHDHGVIHRDIKPGNIMVDRKGVVKILDFGLAKFGAGPTSKADRTEELNLTEKGIVLGTVSYLSPEQASGKPVDHQTDIFSFGILLFEMVEGRNPFKEEEQIETLYNVLNKEVEFQRKLPERLKQIIRKTLEKDKKKRYAGFSQLKDDLEAFHLSYTGLKEEPQAGGGTEVINYREQEKLLKEIQKTSDNEGLGDLVYKIKKFKASTERVSAAGRKKIKWIGLPIVLVILLLVGGYFIVNKIINDPDGTTGNGTAGTDSQFYIYLHPFKNNTGERKLPEKLNYLLTESLNQFKEFKVINEEEAASILEKQEDEEIDLQKLSGKF
ncbi:MAG: protein kinase, partial [bacterium]|nr:protein kinase [bacterium]